MTNPASFSVSLGYGLSVEHIPVPHVVDGPCVLVASDTKGFYMAEGTRFPLSQRRDAMGSYSPKTVVAIGTVELMAFSALVIAMAGATIVGVPGFYTIPWPAIWENQYVRPVTVPFYPLPRRLVVGGKKAILSVAVPAPSRFNGFCVTVKAGIRLHRPCQYLRCALVTG